MVICIVCRYGRSVTLDVNNKGMPVEISVPRMKPKMIQVPHHGMHRRIGETQTSYGDCFGQPDFEHREFEEVPQWAAYDRHVLRFWGYFKESVVESNLENFRVRNVVLSYYLEDDSLSVAEPKTKNCGLAQGEMCKRGQVPHSDGGMIKPKHLIVGQYIFLNT